MVQTCSQPVVPYHLFVSGPGGVGKNHVISLVRIDKRYCRASVTQVTYNRIMWQCFSQHLLEWLPLTSKAWPFTQHYSSLPQSAPVFHLPNTRWTLCTKLSKLATANHLKMMSPLAISAFLQLETCSSYSQWLSLMSFRTCTLGFMGRALTG